MRASRRRSPFEAGNVNLHGNLRRRGETRVVARKYSISREKNLDYTWLLLSRQILSNGILRISLTGFPDEIHWLPARRARGCCGHVCVSRREHTRRPRQNRPEPICNVTRTISNGRTSIFELRGSGVAILEQTISSTTLSGPPLPLHARARDHSGRIQPTRFTREILDTEIS